MAVLVDDDGSLAFLGACARGFFASVSASGSGCRSCGDVEDVFVVLDFVFFFAISMSEGSSVAFRFVAGDPAAVALRVFGRAIMA